MSQARVNASRGGPVVVVCRVCAAPVEWREALSCWVHTASGRATRSDPDGGVHQATPG